MADVSQLIAQLEASAADAFAEAQDALIDVLVAAAPRKTGVLQESFRATIGSSGTVITGTLVNNADYASYVDEGTRPHEIQGNPLLAFEAFGMTVIVHSVQHPGTDPDPFWTDNMTDDQWSFLLQEAFDASTF